MSNGQQMNPPPGWGAAPPNDSQNQTPQGYGYGQPQQQPMNQNPYPPEDIESGKMLAVLGYLISPLWIIPLVQRDNAFALFHAKQAMIYTIFMVILGTVIGIISVITCGFGAILAVAIFPFLYPYIMGIVYAAQGQYQPMPWIGHYADTYLSSFVADQRPQSPPGYP